MLILSYSCLGDCDSKKFTAMPLDPGNHGDTNCANVYMPIDVGCYRDYQEIKVQEQIQKLSFGKISFCLNVDGVTLTMALHTAINDNSVDG